ncbi:MAG: YdcF family protein [Anaerolineae bacterium]
MTYHPAEAIVAISYALQDATTLTPPTRAVMDYAVALWKQRPDAWLIPSTGDNQRLGVTNARVMAAYAEARGVDAAHILEEDRSSNTWENLAYSWELARANGADCLTIVCYDLHVPRCALTARRQRIPCVVFGATSRATGHAARKPWFSSRASIAAYEIGATMYGRLRGHL